MCVNQVLTLQSKSWGAIKAFSLKAFSCHLLGQEGLKTKLHTTKNTNGNLNYRYLITKISQNKSAGN